MRSADEQRPGRANQRRMHLFDGRPLQDVMTTNFSLGEGPRSASADSPAHANGRFLGFPARLASAMGRSRQIRPPLVPGGCLLVCLRERENERFAKRRATELQTNW